MAVNPETSFGSNADDGVQLPLNGSNDPGKSGGWSKAAICGVVLGCVAFIVLVFFLSLLYGNPSHTRIFEWGARAARLRPEQTALNRTYNYDGDVLIIGAGAAGLAAARVLEKNQISYVVLEATDRYGGRLQADATLADFPVDLGAEWIHNLPTTLAVLSGAEDVPRSCWCPLKSFPPPLPGVELISYKMKETHTWTGKKLQKNPNVDNDIAFRFFPEWKFKSSTWFDFVDQYIFKGALDNIQYNSPVAEVDYSGARVQVTTASGELFVADKVIVTASIGVLQSGTIAFVPELSQPKKAAIAAVEFLPGLKLFMKFSEKFYSDALYDGGTDTSGTGEKGFYDVAYKKESTDNVLALLVTGSYYTPYALDSKEAVLAAALKELDTIYDGTPTRTFTGEYRLEDWGRKEFVKGTWVVGSSMEPSVLEAINLPLLDKVFFAGEAHDVNHQLGVPGAIFSGFDAVDLMLQQSSTTTQV